MYAGALSPRSQGVGPINIFINITILAFPMFVRNCFWFNTSLTSVSTR
jgi:hypothetical protein